MDDSTTTAEAVAPFTRHLTIGSVDTGHARRAKVNIQIAYRDDGELSITGDAKRPGAGDIDWGGQINMSLRPLIEEGMAEGKVVIEYEPGWDAARLLRLLDLWDRWHLNRMRPECEHQRAAGWRERASVSVPIYHWELDPDVGQAVRKALRQAEERLRQGETAELADDMKALAALPDLVTTASPYPPSPQHVPRKLTTYSRPSEEKLLGWLRPSEHPDGLLCRPCPECGYEYGSKWLAEEIPAAVLIELRDGVDQTRRDN